MHRRPFRVADGPAGSRERLEQRSYLIVSEARQLITDVTEVGRARASSGGSSGDDGSGGPQVRYCGNLAPVAESTRMRLGARAISAGGMLASLGEMRYRDVRIGSSAPTAQTPHVRRLPRRHRKRTYAQTGPLVR